MMMWKTQVWMVFVILWSGGHSLTCLDPNGKTVDWFSVYKMPKKSHPTDWKLQAGLAHYYLDVNSPKWTLSDIAMNETQHAVANTLNKLYDAQGSNFLYIMYNDESPEELSPSNTGGHTKGVVACDTDYGYWLIHSTPKFPPKKSESYRWPHTAIEYGQTFLCISFPFSQLGNIGTQLLYNQPDIYDKNVPAAFQNQFPVLNDVINKKQPPGPPWSSILNVTSVKGQPFTVFAKAGQFHADLYDTLVAPTLKQDILVETWLRGRGTELSSNCSAKYKVIRITDISFLSEEKISFKETDDHAKWAVTSSSNFTPLKFESEMNKSELSDARWTCIGDINRMVSQFHRGGGTACLNNFEVWKAYRDIISGCSNCNTTDVSTCI